MNLSKIELNKEVKIVKVFGDEKFIKKLNNLGIWVGDVVKVIRVSPFSDTFEIETKGLTVAIRKESAINIEVRYE